MKALVIKTEREIFIYFFPRIYAGDMEVFLELETYMQTAVCAQRTEVLVLELKHYERLLVKRNPRTIELMKANLELRIQSRMSRHLEKSIPLLKIMLTKAEEYNEIRQQQIEARMNTVVEKPAKQTKSMADTFESFVPPRGALIDIYGPGTVFYRIRQREEAKALRAKKGRNLFGGYQGGAGPQRGDQPPGSARGAHQANHLAQQSVDHQTSDPVLTNLENRMKRWLNNDSNKRSDAARVVKLPRSQTEVSTFLCTFLFLFSVSCFLLLFLFACLLHVRSSITRLNLAQKWFFDLLRGHLCIRQTKETTTRSIMVMRG